MCVALRLSRLVSTCEPDLEQLNFQFGPRALKLSALGEGSVTLDPLSMVCVCHAPVKLQSCLSHLFMGARARDLGFTLPVVVGADEESSRS